MSNPEHPSDPASEQSNGTEHAASGREAADPNGPWATLRERLRMAAGLCWFLLLSMVCVVLSAGAHIVLSAARRQSFGRRSLRRIFRMLLAGLDRLGILKCDNRAIEGLRGGGPRLIAANHPSLLDIACVASVLDEMTCVLKAGAARNVLFGPAARLAGLIENSPIRVMVRRCVDELRAGNVVVFFPEGTRTVRFPVNDLGRSLALVSQRSGVPVQTVIIETDSPYLSKGWPMFRRPPFPIRCTVRMGRAFEVPEDAQAWTDELQAYFASELLASAAAGPAAGSAAGPAAGRGAGRGGAGRGAGRTEGA